MNIEEELYELRGRMGFMEEEFRRLREEADKHKFKAEGQDFRISRYIKKIIELKQAMRDLIDGHDKVNPPAQKYKAAYDRVKELSKEEIMD